MFYRREFNFIMHYLTLGKYIMLFEFTLSKYNKYIVHKNNLLYDISVLLFAWSTRYELQYVKGISQLWYK